MIGKLIEINYDYLSWIIFLLILGIAGNIASIIYSISAWKEKRYCYVMNNKVRIREYNFKKHENVPNVKNVPNVRFTSRPTILFLDGLLNLILRSKEEEGIQEHIYQGEFSFLKSFDYNGSSENAIEKLKTNSLKCIEQENIIFLHAEGYGNDNAAAQRRHTHDTQERQNVWQEIVVTSKDYINFWTYRWIALYVYNTINESNRKPTRGRVSVLIKLSSNNLLPYYLMNLKRIDLSYTDLVGSILAVANLKGAYLGGANLEEANLAVANLKGANLGRSNLKGANLGRSNLKGAYLGGANLVGAINLPISIDEAKARGAFA